MSDYLAKYECVECGHEEFYDSDLEMGEDFCAYCEKCTSDLKLVPRPLNAIVIMPEFALQRKTINTYVRHELRQNMTNLPEMWKEVAISKDIDLLKKHAVSGDRIINRDTLEVQEAL